MERFDALVIGAGPAGSTAAILLAARGWSVLLVEGKAFPRRKVCGEYLSATNWPLLQRLGILDPFLQRAGPAVTRTAVFCGISSVVGPLPCSDMAVGDGWGRALSREHLDLLLRDRAVACGADLAQPARCEAVERRGDEFVCQIADSAGASVRSLQTRVVIAAHGSWELGGAPTQRPRQPPRATDWLAFKAHFRDADLPVGLMPLLSFAGGYGGMTHCDDGRVSLSCCVQRSRFATLPRGSGKAAGEAVLEHILESCPVLERVLATAELEGPWLSAGPIQPGIRPRFQGGMFVVGNAAGEAHPVVAEGISMAMQSAWTLCDLLAASNPAAIDVAERQAVGWRYSAAWRRAFALRLKTAAVIAAWAKRPALMRAALPLVRNYPNLLTLGARLSGKSTRVVRGDFSTA